MKQHTTTAGTIHNETIYADVVASMREIVRQNHDGAKLNPMALVLDVYDQHDLDLDDQVTIHELAVAVLGEES